MWLHSSVYVYRLFFFFSSRRRHTRLQGDWSSDVCSSDLPARELVEATRLARLLGVRHLVVRTEELRNPEYAKNPVNRCFFCKEELFTRLAPIAEQEGCRSLVYGANMDDLGDHRPGMKAAQEHGVRAPLIEAEDRKSTRLNSSHLVISYAVFCLKKKKIKTGHKSAIPPVHHDVTWPCAER